MTDHYADAVFSEPGRCWRMVHDGEGSGRPTFCEEPVVWVGNGRLTGGKRVRVWSCQDIGKASSSLSGWPTARADPARVRLALVHGSGNQV